MSARALQLASVAKAQAPDPLVSIGLPVFNGENYLDEAIETIIAQTATDFELILADNASRDGTSEICRSWSERDPRIRWARTENHTGAARNFNRAFELSRGRYFKWAAHDDLIDPTYLERCLALLQSDRSVVLAHSEMLEIDEKGDVLRSLDARIQNMESESTAARFKGAIALDHGCFDVFGLIRREALEETKLIAPYLGSDRVLLAELALRGRLVRVPEFLFRSREHPNRSIRLRSERVREQWFGAGVPPERIRPNWRRLKEVRGALARADVPFGVRTQCRVGIAQWAVQQGGSLYREMIGRSRATDMREKEPPPASLPEEPDAPSTVS